MATATELTINTSATALDMANEMFGDGIQIVSATYTGDPVSAGIYSDATSTIPGVVPSDSGVILSTGNVGSFTNGSGTADTNLQAGTSTDTTGVNGDAQLNAIAGTNTFDAAIFEANFIPTGDFITMQFVFSSEEYLEYVNGGFNDAVGVWVNGDFVPLSIVHESVSIDNVNTTSNQNLYVNNPAATDPYNTEMDGFTITLSLKAPVNSGQVNTIRIGIADAGDPVYDSNLLIMGDSIQTVALAYDDTINMAANSSRTYDILANDTDLNHTGLHITHINGQPIAVGGTVTLATGEQVTLNADGTVTVTTDGDIGANSFTYTVEDGLGNTDIGFITVNTTTAPAADGIVDGTSGDDMIDTAYLGDPDGDRIDAGDALLAGQVGEDDIVVAGDGNDTVVAGLGDDVVYGGAGQDSLYGEDGADTLFGSTGADMLEGGLGADVLVGGDDADLIRGASGDVVDGGEGGTDQDTLTASGVLTIAFDPGNPENGTITFIDNSTLTFSNIEHLILNGGNPDGIVYGTAAADLIGAGYVDVNGDVIDNGDAIFAGAGPDDDEVFAGDGNDTVFSGAGDDDVYGGNDQDVIHTGIGNDYAQGDTGDDTVYGDAGDDFLRGDAGSDSVYGGDGNDSVYGGLGTDQVFGGDGNDYIYGGYGDDTVYGGAGNDTITGSGENDLVYGDDGDDFMQGSNGADTLIGGLGADTMLGEEDADSFYGGAGDYVDGYETVTTGTDNDTLHVEGVASVSWDPFNSENGTITFTAGGTLAFYNIENLFVDGVLTTRPDGTVSGTAGNDLIDTAYLGDPDGDRIDNNDASLVGHAPNDDLVVAGDGFDTVMAGLGDDTVYGGAGQDVLYGGEGDDSLLGGDNADLLFTDAGNDSLLGEGGDDSFQITDGFGTDVVVGGETGETFGDVLNVSSMTGDVVLDLSAGNPASDEDGTLTSGTDSLSFSQIEAIVLGGGNDVVIGSSGDDFVAVGWGADSIDGGAGNDTFEMEFDGDADVINFADGDGADTLLGFDAPIDNGDGTYSGVDTLDVSGMTDALGNPVNVADVTVLDDGMGNAVLLFPGGESLTLVGVTVAAVSSPAALEALGIPPVPPDGIVEGTAGGDLIDTSYLGDPGGDRIDASDALLPGAAPEDDYVLAGAGDDTIESGLGNDSVLGGDGADGIFGGAGADTLLGEAGADYIEGGDGADTLDGGADNDELYGGLGDDLVQGGSGADWLEGDLGIYSSIGGNDTLQGGDGSDTILGNRGNDLLTGDAGDDSLLGEAGADTLDGGLGADTLLGGDDRDTFLVGAGDVVDGGNGGDDYDTLDLSAYGWGNTNVIYDPGNSENGTVQFLDSTGAVTGTMAFTDIEHVVPCFTPGTLILTAHGEVRVEDLVVDDQVLTRDHGLQTIRWVGRRDLSRADLARQPRLSPVRIRKGALGGALPDRDMLVSPQHRMLFSGARAEMFFGEDEVLVAATHLVGEAGVERIFPNGVSYIHIMFDQHEIISADGAWTESFQPGDLTLKGLDQAQRDELLMLFPELADMGSFYPAARRTLRSHEARVMLAS
ncbi:Hint domain-containing protein [Rhodobacter ferrooxidans]|uniref:Hemolysin-type calcium-binding region n=1 Tax=Rhodobacter ferrooxidans TaxID=371731 RepID=C8RY14_9RHOB|nr:Hint domain-containing protein [Rhodobacter sp. SW2]EEW26412.1 Hemolysin-type calcium-binding region [Rhodobacter sp. SW2]